MFVHVQTMHTKLHPRTSVWKWGYHQDHYY